MESKLIAPCGMNCGVCLHYLRAENKCPGCFAGYKANDKPNNCKRRLCKKRTGEYCFSCETFPCADIQKLDERYRKRYGMSEIENLEHIRDHGMDAFIEKERKKWINDDGVFCVHDKQRYPE